MYSNYEYIEAMKKQREKQKHILENGNTIFHTEYGTEYQKVSIKIIECDGNKYYLAENWAGAVIELREI